MANDYKWSMNVVVARGSLAESIARKWAVAPMGAVAEPRALAGGIPATPDHDLVFRGGKTIPQLKLCQLLRRRKGRLGKRRCRQYR